MDTYEAAHETRSMSEIALPAAPDALATPLLDRAAADAPAADAAPWWAADE
jgi:hypothetical protein